MKILYSFWSTGSLYKGMILSERRDYSTAQVQDRVGQNNTHYTPIRKEIILLANISETFFFGSEKVHHTHILIFAAH